MSILTVQQKLKAAGFDPGPLDGKWGSRTAFALDAALSTAQGARAPAAVSFDVAIDRVLAHEGGYVNNPRDPGGETNWGISKRAYPSVNIRTLTREGAKAIYRRDYWDAVRGDELPACVAFQVFDVAVNHGVSRAVKFLQEAVGVLVDGRLGALTMAAIQKQDGTAIALRYNAARLRFYTSLNTWPTFGKGWARRVAGNLDFAAADCV